MYYPYCNSYFYKQYNNLSCDTSCGWVLFKLNFISLPWCCFFFKKVMRYIINSLSICMSFDAVNTNNNKSEWGPGSALGKYKCIQHLSLYNNKL